jgi:hypothetical protein
VLCDDLIEYHDKINLSYIPQTSELYDLQKPEFTTFNLNLVWEEVYKNNLWNELSNSFLVLSGNYKNVESNIAYHYSINRIEKFQKEIIFTKNFKVNKNFINKIEVDPNEYAPFTVTLVEEDFANGENWESKLHRILSTPGWTFNTLSEWLKVWINCFKKEISFEGEEIPLEYMFDGKYLDAIPRNLIVLQNGYQFIDLEVRYIKKISFKYIVLRCLYNSFLHINKIKMTESAKLLDDSKWNLIKKTLLVNGIWLNYNDYLSFLDQESEFQYIFINNLKLNNFNDNEKLNKIKFT